MKGSYKGIWPQEANNIPEHFIKSLTQDDWFYFFDYYLTSGASWKGVIGEEIVTLQLHGSWKGHELFSSFGPEIVKNEKQGKNKAYTFTLRQSEPSRNLIFALKRPTLRPQK